MQLLLHSQVLGLMLTASMARGQFLLLKLRMTAKESVRDSLIYI